MGKLKIKQTYFTRCGYCENLNEYLARDINVNSSIIDEDMYRIAARTLGETSAEWCENCNKMTAQTRVAYGLEPLPGVAKETK